MSQPPDVPHNAMPNIPDHALHGTAYLWHGGNQQIEPVFDPRGSSAVLLGSNANNPELGLFWVPGEAEGHGLTFGATRSGKGVAAIIPALMTYFGSCVVIDPKGENSWTSSPRRRALGQRVVILDHWGEVNRRYAGEGEGETITRFNPLSALDPSSPDFADDVAAVADALIINNSSDPHWSDSARELVGGLIAAFVEARPGKATLRDVRRALLQSPEDFTETVGLFEKITPEGDGTRKLAGFKGDNREINSIRSTARTQTAFLDSIKLQEGMETDDPIFDLAELATGRVTLYLVLPVDRLQTHGRWLRLILTLAIRAIARQAALPRLPVLFLLDEMGTVGRLSMVEQAFGLMAGLGIRLWGFLQDINQVKRDYPESWETFIANSSFIQVLNARDQSTSEYFSEYMGNVTVESLTAETRRQRRIANARGADSYVKSERDSRLGRPIFFPDELRRIDRNKSVVIITDGQSILIDKVSYFADPRLRPYHRPLPAYKDMPIPVFTPPLPIPRPTSMFEDFVATVRSKLDTPPPESSAPIDPHKPVDMAVIIGEMKAKGWKYNFNLMKPGCKGPNGESERFATNDELIAWWREGIGRPTP